MPTLLTLYLEVWLGLGLGGEKMAEAPGVGRPENRLESMAGPKPVTRRAATKVGVYIR